MIVQAHADRTSGERGSGTKTGITHVHRFRTASDNVDAKKEAHHMLGFTIVKSCNEGPLWARSRTPD